MNNIKKKYKGGFCNPAGKNCNKILVNIDPSSVLNSFLKAIFAPINFIIKGIFYIIKFSIEYWNDLIIRLSYVFEDLIYNIIYSLNGYLNIINLIFNEIKALMSISLNLLTNNPFSLLAILITPVVQEFFAFFLDSVTIQFFTNAAFLDFSSLSAFVKSLNVFKPIFEFFVASFYLLIGKTVKSKCDLSLYGNNIDRINDCHEYYVPKCRLNLRAIYNIVFYILIILYFAGWLSFFKIFYGYEANTSIISYLRNRYM